VANVWAQVVEADLADPRLAACGLEAPCDLGAVERRAEVRMGENEIVVAAVRGAMREAVELAEHAVCQRHRATRG
jgi:hypothetical protein